MNSTEETKFINREETDKLTIVGAGFSGLMTALLAYLEYRSQNKKLRITIIGDQAPTDSPASNLCASISHNEIAAVTPSPAEAKMSIEQLYNVPGGIAATLEHLKTPKAIAFIEELYKLSEDPEKLKNDQVILEKYGEYCMLLWQRLMEILHEQHDVELLEIFESFSSLLLPAAPGVKDDGKNHRVDIYIDTPKAISKTSSLINHLQQTGYIDSRLLSPKEYLEYFPYSQEFVVKHTDIDRITGEMVWHDNVSVARRPAGRINANQFMKYIAEYLKRNCGEYINENGQVKSYFRIKNRKVTKLVTEDKDSNSTLVVDVEMVDSKTNNPISTNRQDRNYRGFFYTVNTGSKIRAIDDLGIKVPNTALFAGTYLQLRIPIDKLPPEYGQSYTNLALRCGNGAGGVHTSVAQFYPDHQNSNVFVLHCAGTKIFCGYTQPVSQGNLEDFAYDRLLIQLNMLRITFPSLLKLVLGEKLEQYPTRETIDYLVENGIAKIGVESRNVSTTNAPYVGPVIFKNGKKASNAGVCSGPSSAGIAYGIGYPLGIFESTGLPSRLFEGIEVDEAAKRLMTKI